jgi:multidrug efflux pump subunit AcrB
MSRFAIHNPYFVVVVCLIIAVVGVTSLLRMPVDMFPAMNIPVVVVATFYSGMPPEQIETDITSRFERFFTLGSGIEHIESRSLPGVSVIKVYFQPGTNPDSAVTTISNLAMAQLRRLPPGTLPPVVLKFDASSLPVCLVTFKGEGLNETQLRDLAQFQVRNQLGSVAGASVPQPFGGRYRQIMAGSSPSATPRWQSVPGEIRAPRRAGPEEPAVRRRRWRTFGAGCKMQEYEATDGGGAATVLCGVRHSSTRANTTNVCPQPLERLV